MWATWSKNHPGNTLVCHHRRGIWYPAEVPAPAGMKVQVKHRVQKHQACKRRHRWVENMRKFTRKDWDFLESMGIIQPNSGRQPNKKETQKSENHKVYRYYQILILALILATTMNIDDLCWISRLWGFPTSWSFQNKLSKNSMFQEKMNKLSLGWFKGKSTGNHGFYHQI